MVQNPVQKQRAAYRKADSKRLTCQRRQDRKNKRLLQKGIMPNVRDYNLKSFVYSEYGIPDGFFDDPKTGTRVYFEEIPEYWDEDLEMWVPV